MTVVSNSLASARDLREELRGAMIDLEATISSPSSAPFWFEGVVRQMEMLRMALSRHISDVESPDGIISQIIRDAPRLAGSAEHLAADHADLTKATGHTLKAIRSLGPEPTPAQAKAVRETVLELLGRLSRHRQHGVDLVYEAYDFDIGGTG